MNGSCCCGAIKFELLAEPSMMGTCHCTRCRKVGASTIIFVKKKDLKWIQGRDHVQVFEPVPPLQIRSLLLQNLWHIARRNPFGG